MGFLRTAALLAGGAIAGYLASQTQERRKHETSTELERQEHSAQELLTQRQANMAKFFDSPLGKPLQPYALKAVKFAATVKQGMNEREEQLKTKFDAHVEDVRPGSLDGWEEEPGNRPLESAEPGDYLESEVVEVDSAEGIRQRMARDTQLGKDFFA
ncbi:peptide chain release factor 4 [Rothia sp. ZJ932]|uniref:peptide chain release factor 4 n=1 Tax=Rothia sp. ZJ932 TaxID=2810516 RepID=UPI0019672B1D|nr:peptide chain release factor 4 [Rothia sp. ZJ932]QRZ62466.1 peptide chain release factor 4 [Rothia sp. ZJ932]